MSRILRLSSVALVALAMLVGCGEVARDGEAERGPLGKADAFGSCASDDGVLCGGPSDGNCWCDSDCSVHGDCCDDYVPVCEGRRVFTFDFRTGSSTHGFEVIYRDIPESIYTEYSRRRDQGLDLGPTAPLPDGAGPISEPDWAAANASHWQMNNGLIPLPDGLPGYGYLVQGNNHSDDMDMYIVREFGPDDGVEPNVTYEVTFLHLQLAANAPLGAFGVGGSPDLDIGGVVTATNPFDYVVDYNRHVRHPAGVFANRTVNLGTTAVCLQPGGAVSIPGVPLCPSSGRIPYSLNDVEAPPTNNSRYATSVTANAEGRFWLMVGGHSGYESFSAYFHTFLSVVVTKQ